MGDRLETLLANLVISFRATRSKITVSPNVTTTSVKILAANDERAGLIIYNNSANSGYVCFGQAANSSTSMSVIIPTFTQIIFPLPTYPGDIYAIRNAGTGAFIITELFP